eukprot:scaffold162782_cov18-Prasinocladus_malaysianus.AAC.1
MPVILHGCLTHRGHNRRPSRTILSTLTAPSIHLQYANDSTACHKISQESLPRGVYERNTCPDVVTALI